MNWCCLGFEGHYGNVGNRGSAILIGKDFRGEAEFTLQFRALEPKCELPESVQNVVSTVLDVRIKYCPWCGEDLRQFYGQNIEDLHRKGFKIEF